MSHRQIVKNIYQSWKLQKCFKRPVTKYIAIHNYKLKMEDFKDKE